MNEVTDTYIKLTDECTDADKQVIKDNSTLPVYTEIELSQDVIDDLGRDTQTHDRVKIESTDSAEPTIDVINSYIVPVYVLLPIDPNDNTGEVVEGDGEATNESEST